MLCEQLIPTFIGLVMAYSALFILIGTMNPTPSDSLAIFLLKLHDGLPLPCATAMGTAIAVILIRRKTCSACSRPDESDIYRWNESPLEDQVRVYVVDHKSSVKRCVTIPYNAFFIAVHPLWRSRRIATGRLRTREPVRISKAQRQSIRPSVPSKPSSLILSCPPTNHRRNAHRNISRQDLLL